MTTYNTGNPIGSKDPRDLYDNAENMDEAVNSSADTFQDRLGKSRLTWAGIVKAGSGDPAIAVDAADRAEAAASNVEQNAEQIAQDAAQQAISEVIAGVDGQVAVAQSAADRAEAEANRAELGAEAALTSGWIYSSVTDGEAERSDGDYFWVVSVLDDQSLELWLMGASSATDTGKRTLSSRFAMTNFSDFVWEQGGIGLDDGSLTPSPSRVRTLLYKALYLSATAAAGKRLIVHLYDDDGSYISNSGYVQNYPLTRIDGNFRIAVRNHPDDTTNILPYENGVSTTIDFWTKESIQRQEQAVPKNESGRIDEYFWSNPLFEPGSAIESWGDYNPEQFVSLEIWDRDESDSFYLNSFYRFYLAAGDRQASVGFKRVSDNKHVCAAPAPIIGGTDPNQYARWSVTQPPSGIQSYYLYVEGETSRPPIGLVKVNWDIVPANQSRYIGTDGLTPVVTENLGKTLQKTKIVRSNEVALNPLFGKKIVGLGDSITYGFIPRNAPGYPGQLNSWLVLVANALGMTHVNYGISGSTLGDLNNGTRDPFTGRYQTMDDDADVIVVMGGTNDVRNGVPLGTMADRTPYTYYGALHVLCDGLIDKYQVQQGLTIGKDKIIFFMTPIKLLDPNTGDLDTSIEPYAEAVKEVCAYYSLPVFDSYNLSGITPHILQTVQGTEPGYTGMYNPYITDGTHPTQEGHDKMARVIAGFIKSLA